MGWIVGITHEQGSLRVIERTDAGDEAVRLVDASLRLSTRNDDFRTGEYTELLFSDLEPTTDADAFDRLGIPAEVRRVQTIFRYRQGRKTFYIPAQVLITGLFCQNTMTRDSLLTPAGYEMAAVLVDMPDGSVDVEVDVVRHRRGQRITPQFKNMLLWTVSFPSAKRMVASVFANALSGRFDLQLPACRASVSFPGLQVGEEVLAQNVRVEWMQPLEAPLPGLEGRVSLPIVFRERKTGARKGMRHRKPSTDEDLNLGAAGWRLSDEEWNAIRGILESVMTARALNGRGLGKNAKLKMEAILRKFSERVAWLSAGETPNDGANAQSFWGTLKKDGRWERIKQYLNEVRAT